MTSLSLSKQRTSRRRRAGGAVMIIVALTIAVLASLGAFALTASSQEIRMSGYGRQFTQDQYLAEFATNAEVQRLSLQTTEGPPDVKFMKQSSQFGRGNGCASLPANMADAGAIEPTLCRRIEMGNFAQDYPSQVALRPSSPTAAGSLGAIPVAGNLYAELSDLSATGAPASGYSVSGGPQTAQCANTVTVTSYGLTQPNNVGSNTTQQYGSEGLVTHRARVSFMGPCP